MKKIFITTLIIFISLVFSTSVLGTTGTVKSDELNVRSAASTNSESMGKLHKNDIVDILEEENDEWYKIDYDDNIGFVYKEYVEVKTDDSNDSATTENSTEENTTKKEEETESKEKTENDNNNNNNINNNKLLKDAELYILPLLNSIKIDTIKAETEVNIISNNGKWLYVQTDTESGWIISSTLIEQNNEQQKENDEETKNNETDNNETTSETNNNESENSTSENATIEEDTNKTSESQSEDNNEYPITMYVTGDSVNIRKSASTSSAVISGTAKNAAIKVIGKEGDWYKVDTEDGIGYIKENLLSKQKN